MFLIVGGIFIILMGLMLAILFGYLAYDAYKDKVWSAAAFCTTLSLMGVAVIVGVIYDMVHLSK